MSRTVPIMIISYERSNTLLASILTKACWSCTPAGESSPLLKCNHALFLDAMDTLDETRWETSISRLFEMTAKDMVPLQSTFAVLVYRPRSLNEFMPFAFTVLISRNEHTPFAIPYIKVCSPKRACTFLVVVICTGERMLPPSAIPRPHLSNEYSVFFISTSTHTVPTHDPHSSLECWLASFAQLGVFAVLICLLSIQSVRCPRSPKQAYAVPLAILFRLAVCVHRLCMLKGAYSILIYFKGGTYVQPCQPISTRSLITLTSG
ncbi:hypothetical protein C8R42DRAFT_317803 [Lentinula raphanica]|nr:hypothetical protein C8R42DRAFT_317803 [Lentinula raphanica]